MKTTFNLEQSDPSHQITTNTLTFDDGQVKQTSATNELKEKIPIRRISSATVTSTPKRASLPKVKYIFEFRNLSYSICSFRKLV